MILDLNSDMQPGTQYTFSFNASGWNPVKQSLSDIISELQGTDELSGVTASYSGGVGGLFASQVDVTFVFSSGSDYVVSDVVEIILSRIGGYLYSYDFVSAQDGSSGSITSTGDIANQLSSFGLNTTTLYAVVIGLVIIAFLASGGAGVARRVTA